MRFLILVASLWAFAVPSFAQAPDPAPSTPVETLELAAFEPTREEAVLEAYIDGVVAAHMREHDIPGASVSVVWNGRVLFAKGYGVQDADGKAVSGQDTLFRIGSVSKTFIWTSVMILAERGQINLEADVNLYLKDLHIPEAFGAPVTMNDLMAHRAGFEDTLAVFTVKDDSELTLTEALKAHMPKRVYAPGARTSYSNWGSALAAKIIEDIAGVSYETFLQNEILTPLAMTNTTLKGPDVMADHLRANLSTGLSASNGWPEETDYMQIGPYAPAGAMASTADDMARWMLLHLGGGAHDGVRLLSSPIHDLMWSRAFRDRAGGADLAHGFMSNVYRGYDTYGHGGATSAFYTNMVLAPELSFGVYVSQNATSDRTLVSDLAQLIIDRLAPAGRGPGETQKNDALAEKAADYAGTYLHNRRSFSLFEKFFAVNSVAMVAAQDDGALLISTQDNSVRYAPLAAAEDVFQDRYGARLIFGRDENGDVTHFSDGSGVHSYDRAGLLDNPQVFNMAFGAALLFSLTTWLGAWRRQSGPVNQKPIGAIVNLVDLGAAATCFAFVAAIVVTITALSNASASDLLDYPPAVVTAMRMIALALFIFSLVVIAGLWPAWRSSGWSLWRKLHHTALALSLGALGVMLVQWNVIFAATV